MTCFKIICTFLSGNVGSVKVRGTDRGMALARASALPYVLACHG